MKRLVGVLVAIIVIYAIYHDLSIGTLPAATTEKAAVTTMTTVTKKHSASQLPYFEKKVVSGDTVLSILEEKLDRSVPVPISKVETDFEMLNNGISPQKIKPGKVYKFPDYQNK